MSSRISSVRHRRRLVTRILLFSLCLGLVLSGLYIYDQYPPSYSLERSLVSQFHDSQRYVLFKQIRGAGFNNQLQEYLLHHALAKKANRAMVYQDFIWRYRGYDEVPLAAFSSSLVESPAIHETVFWQRCQPENVKNITINVRDENKRWQTALAALEAESSRCVRVENWLFYWDFLESANGIKLWPEVQSELASFRWSDRVYEAFYHNAASFGLEHHWESTLAIHLRRGDFSYHCADNGARKATFNLWNNHPDLPSSLSPLPSTYEDIYAHCYPTLDSVRTRIMDVLSANPHLTHLHILHSGAWDTPMTYLFIYRLKWSLPSDLNISHTGNLRLEFKEKDFGVPVDMEIARRAGVFIGNGYSSLSSDVVGLRIADGRRAVDTNLFW